MVDQIVQRSTGVILEIDLMNETSMQTRAVLGDIQEIRHIYKHATTSQSADCFFVRKKLVLRLKPLSAYSIT